MTRTLRRVLIAAALVVSAVMMVVFYTTVAPDSGFYPRCYFHLLTGLQCPGCGLQRMLNHLFHGEIGDAFRSNGFVLCALPFIVWFAIAELLRKRKPALYEATFSTPVIIVTGVAVAAWMVARNLLGI